MAKKTKKGSKKGSKGVPSSVPMGSDKTLDPRKRCPKPMGSDAYTVTMMGK